MSNFDRYASNFDKADVFQKTPNLLVGQYPKLRITEFKFHQGRQDDFIICELEVVESRVHERAPGSKVSWVVNMKHDPSPGEVKGFIGAVFGLTKPDEIKAQITTAVLNHCISSAQPLRGKLVACEVFEKATQAGKMFAKHRWEPVDGQVASVPSAQPMTPPPATSVPAVPPPVPAAAPPPPAPPAVFPPQGWQAHPSAPGYFYNPTLQAQGLPPTEVVKSEHDLRIQFGL